MTRLALCLLLLATGASAAEPPYGLKVFRDEARGITCYMYAPGPGAAIDCIPDSQLQAGNQRQLSPHETQPEPTPAMAPGRWIDERYEL